MIDTETDIGPNSPEGPGTLWNSGMAQCAHVVHACCVHTRGYETACIGYFDSCVCKQALVPLIASVEPRGRHA